VAGKECRFSVTLNEGKEQRLPEMDDEWAKGAGDGYASLAELRQKVQEDLTAQAQQQARQAYEGKVLEQLIGDASLEYPPILVEHEVEHLLQDQQQRLSSLGLDLERYFAITQRNQEEVVEELRVEAKRRVANTLILNDLARVDGLEATTEEEEEEIGRLTGGEATPERREQVQRLFSTPEAREPLRRAVLSRKTMQRLVQIARGEKAAQPAAEKPAEDAAKAAVEERSGAS
jgi:trigger factor